VQERERDFGVGLNDFFNTVLSKSDKDGEEWRDTDPLGTGDRLNAAKLLQRAEEFISNPKKGPTFARAVFYIVAAGSLVEHDLTVWPSVRRLNILLFSSASCLRSSPLRHACNLSKLTSRRCHVQRKGVEAAELSMR
jgi:hypothetical protein